MTGLKIGYARVSTDDQDLTAQRDALAALGVAPERTYVDHGLTGTNRDRPGLREAMAACRAGDALVVTKLDRLARSLPDARDIVAELTARDVALSRRTRSTTRSPAGIGRTCTVSHSPTAPRSVGPTGKVTTTGERTGR